MQTNSARHFPFRVRTHTNRKVTAQLLPTWVKVTSDNISYVTCTHTLNHFTALWILYQKQHSPTYTYRGHQSSLICFTHLIRSMASSLFNPCTWQSFSTISLQVFFRLPLGLTPSTSYSIHFFTQSLSSFCNTHPYHCSLFCIHHMVLCKKTGNPRKHYYFDYIGSDKTVKCEFYKLCKYYFPLLEFMW